MLYEVNLGFFTGPLDLLLYLVRKEEVPIRDIEISKICDQYVAYLEAMRELDLDVAGEFLVMAAVLMRIKANELLPKSERETLADDPDFIDREKLLRQIEEYEKFKNVSRDLRGLEEENFGAYYRATPEESPFSADAFLEGREVEVFDLIMAFKRVLDGASKAPEYFMEADNVTIDDRIEFVMGRVGDGKRTRFADLFAHDPRKIVIVVTFMAILELIKMRYLWFTQDGHLGDIWLVERSVEDADAPAQGASPLTPA
jgi:segregation and condensation protein A